jgi:hypothetical protein
MQQATSLLDRGAPQEEHMKKTYLTPTVILAGNAVRETMSIDSGTAEPENFLKVSGSVGFNL